MKSHFAVVDTRPNDNLADVTDPVPRLVLVCIFPLIIVSCAWVDVGPYDTVSEDDGQRFSNVLAAFGLHGFESLQISFRFFQHV